MDSCDPLTACANEPVLYSDDTKLICDILSQEWSLDFDRPHFYYDQDALARNNTPGSIYVYSMGISYNRIGINYGNVRKVHRMAIDVQNPMNRERHFRYCNEILRIIQKYRRAGPCVLKGGWEYIEFSNFSFKQGYTKFYQSVMDMALIRELQPLEAPGFGTACCPMKEGDEI